MSKRKDGLYKLTAGDRAIFAAAGRERNLNRVLNYYMRGEDHGTWWRPVTQEDIDALEVDGSIKAARRWKDGYETLLAIWQHLGKPDYFAPVSAQSWEAVDYKTYEKLRGELSRVYRLQWDYEIDAPIFHHPHGVQLIGWQEQMARSTHPLQVVVGGFGSSKTWGKLLIMLARSVMLPGYRAFVLAPYSNQAEEAHKQILQMIEGTEFERRFFIKGPTRPRPHIVFGNDHVGETLIEFYPILDDPGKILTLSGDEAMVDQSEQIEDLDTLVRNVGSRLRGMYRGRPRVGQLTLIANSADNPNLWDLFDEAEADPDYVWSYQPGTYENPYLTVADLKRFEKQVGRDEHSRRVHLAGERPIGSGEHFSAESLRKCRADWMDDRMSEMLKKGVPGWIRQESERVAVHQWIMPPEEGEKYIVAADAGCSNPPDRNSAVIGVWKITDFPMIPAQLVGFDWVFGHGSPNPWIASYTEKVINYKAIGMNGFDATGFQSGYERFTDISALLPMPVSLNGNNKYVYLNYAKRFMANGLFQIPNIPHLFSQCAKYRLPDDRIRQDIVMMLVITSALLEPFYLQYISTDEQEQPERDYDPRDRHYRPYSDRDLYHERR